MIAGKMEKKSLLKAGRDGYEGLKIHLNER